MKFTLRWLKDHLDTEASLDALGEKLTVIGLEIESIEDRAKADGVVTKKERARIHKAQNVESKRIYRQKHDRQVKPQ